MSTGAQSVNAESKASEQASEKKICIACGYKIPISASLCSECSSFQSSWKNTARYLANVVGILSVAVAVATYVISALPELRRSMAWSESIRVLAFNSSEYSFANEGDGELFLSHISVRFSLTPGDKRRGTAHIPIRKVVKSGAILGGTLEMHERAKTATIVADVSKQEWEALYTSAVGVGNEACTYRVFHAVSDPQFTMVSEYLGDRLRTFVVDAELHYYSPHSHSMQTTAFEAVGLLSRSRHPDCTTKK